MSARDPRVLGLAAQRFSDLDHVPIGLAVLSEDLTVLYWNATLELWTGILREAAVGTVLSQLNPVWAKPHYAGRLSHLFTGGPPVVFSHLLHPKIIPTLGEPRAYHVKAAAVPDGQGAWWAFLTVEDVTVLSRRVEELRALHGQQERMMREIHHRVKNSLNMISGLITMQKLQPGIEAAQEPLSDLQSRIVAISEIHDLLYHSSSLSTGSTADYLAHLAHLLDTNLSFSDTHRLVLDLDSSIVLKTDSTVLLGLIQAELMTNALKYGLVGDPDEVLSIRLARTEPKTCEYSLTHTGDRLPTGFDPATSEGLGMVLLSAYVGQLGTALRWTKGDPTRFWLEFPE